MTTLRHRENGADVLQCKVSGFR